MSSNASAVTIRTRKFVSNPLLMRKQFVIEILTPGGGVAPSKTELRQKLAALFKVADVDRLVVFGIRNQFGGGKSTGFGFIYDSVDALKKIEPRYRQVRVRFAFLFLRKQAISPVLFRSVSQRKSPSRPDRCASSARTDRRRFVYLCLTRVVV